MRFSKQVAYQSCIRYAPRLETVLNWVSVYGYLAIFVLLILGIAGLPVPDEVLLVFSGFLIHDGRLNGPGTFAAALMGSVWGITGSYLLGYKIGLPLIHSKVGRHLHISDAQIRRTHDWFHRVGHWALFVGYYIPGVRHFTALVAGTARLEDGNFALYCYPGAIGWVSTFLFIGFHFGDQWQSVLLMVERNLRVASLIAL